MPERKRPLRGGEEQEDTLPHPAQDNSSWNGRTLGQVALFIGMALGVRCGKKIKPTQSHNQMAARSNPCTKLLCVSRQELAQYI
jgi:hypothetical protein